MQKRATSSGIQRRGASKESMSEVNLENANLVQPKSMTTNFSCKTSEIDFHLSASYVQSILSMDNNEKIEKEFAYSSDKG